MNIDQAADTSISHASAMLLEKLSPYLNFLLIPPGKRLYIRIDGQPQCYFIRKGWCSLYHHADEVLIGTCSLPGIIGIGGAIPEDAKMYIKTQVESEIAIAAFDDMQAIIENLGLWEDLSKHIARLTNLLYLKNVQLTAPTSYEILRFQLLELIKEPAEIRENIAAANYIQLKTQLSRSTIMKVLAQLKQGGYVKIDNGILKEISHLPLRY